MRVLEQFLKIIFWSSEGSFNSRIGKLHNENLLNFFFLPTGSIIMASKSRRLRWLTYVVHMEGMKIHTKYLSENGKRTDLLGDLSLDEENTIKIYFMEVVWMGYFWLRIGSNDVRCEHSNEPMGLRQKY